jgi:hypothetical protein
LKPFAAAEVTSKAPTEGLRIGVSADGGHYAFVSPKAGKEFLVIDGRAPEGSGYDQIIAFLFTSDGKHLAMQARDGKKWVVAVNGVVIASYDNVDHLFGLTVGEDSHVAYGVNMGKESFLVLDGKHEKVYPGIREDSVQFSPDNRLAYIAKTEKGLVAVVGDSESKPYDLLPYIVFSRDGKRFGHPARVGAYQVAVVDGVEGKKYDEVDYIRFSPNGKRVAFVAIADQKQFVVVDGKDGKGYTQIVPHTLSFSPDSRRVGYVSSIGDEENAYAVVDGKQGMECAVILKQCPLFSPDSRHYAYLAEINEMWAVVRDGIPGKTFGGFLDQGSLVYSPDSKHLAYVSLPSTAAPGTPEHTKNSGSRVIMDNYGGKMYDEVSHAAFTADNRHLVYTAKSGDRALIVVDDSEHEVGDGIVQDYVFDGPRRLRCWVRRQDKIFQVEHEISDNTSLANLRSGITGKVIPEPAEVVKPVQKTTPKASARGKEKRQ